MQICKYLYYIIMAKKNDSTNLHIAKAKKEDEFYTQLSTIENELRHYKEHFYGKVVFCNCDDPRVSNFFKYFSINFEHLGLKRLICTCYKNQDIDLFTANKAERAVYTIYEGDKNNNRVVDREEIEVHELNGDGDFRSKESIELLKQADIVCTNPPFSLFREYMAQLIAYNKKFVIIGNQGAASYKEIFPLIRDNKIWLGYHSGHTVFDVPEDYTLPEKYKGADKSLLRSNGYILDDSGNLIQRNLGNICWFTNLDIEKRHENIILYKKYSPEEYIKYDNFDAINVDEVQDIPIDYYGMMGVPISFLDKYNPEQFVLVGIGSGTLAASIGVKKNYRGRTDISYTSKNGKPKCPFGRIIIKRK